MCLLPCSSQIDAAAHAKVLKRLMHEITGMCVVFHDDTKKYNALSVYILYGIPQVNETKIPTYITQQEKLSSLLDKHLFKKTIIHLPQKHLINHIT